jgi:hypothetical protein
LIQLTVRAMGKPFVRWVKTERRILFGLQCPQRRRGTSAEQMAPTCARSWDRQGHDFETDF